MRKITTEQLKRYRVRQEIKLQILKTISSFKSKEEPKLKVTKLDFFVAISELLNENIVRKFK